MSSLLISYASRGFEPYQALNEVTARRAGFDEVRCFGPDNLEEAFVRDNSEILGQERGDGYWLWKPYLCARALHDLSPGDHLFYCDAAAHFVSSIDPMLELMADRALDLLVLGEGFRESQYTKRDAFVLMDCDSPEYAASAQRFASFFLLRKGPWASHFVERYLDCARDPRILTDRANELGLPDHPDFVDHRHDQSIFSLLTKKLGVEVPATGFVAEGLSEPAGQILNHTRTHFSPGQIVQFLLSRRLVGLDDLDRFRVGTP